MKAVAIVYHDLCKAFIILSDNILTDKLRKCGLDKWTAE